MDDFRSQVPDWYREMKAKALAEAEQERPDDGRCCGAPPEPIATTRFVDWHNRGACFGERDPCGRARACAALYRRLYNRGWATLTDAVEPQPRIGGRGTPPVHWAQLKPGECCGAPDEPEPTGKYYERHLTRGTQPCPQALASSSLRSKIAYHRRKARAGR